MKERKYFDIEWYSQIVYKIENRKNNSVILELESYLEKYPYDTRARTTYATLLIESGRLEEAEVILNDTIITKKTVDRNLYELLKAKIKLLCNQRRYEECYKLFLENDLLLKQHFEDYYSLLLFLKITLGLEVNVSEYPKSYTIEQLISYSEEKAIEHIMKHVDNFDEKNNTCFCSDFPVEELYYKLRNMLPLDTDKCLCSGFFKSKYIFKCEGNGRNFTSKVDYIKVVCIRDTNDIITMFPYENKSNLPVIDLDLGIKQVENEKSKVKRMSQIDKFNQRYSKN